MLKTGLTGGIGSGKTTVARIFELLGVPVYYADDRGKALMRDDPGVRAKVQSLFGAEAYDDGGELNRSYIADRVFQDAQMLEKLNAIVHPAVAQDFRDWCGRRAPGTPYVIEEAALIFEIDAHRRLDKTILVYAPEALRISRVVARDGTTEEQVRARMERQMDDHSKVPLADFIIVNDGAHSLVRQALEIHRILTRATSIVPA